MAREIQVDMSRESVDLEDLSSRLAHKKVCNINLKRNQNTLLKGLEVINELVKSGRLHAEGEYEIIRTPERLKEVMETYLTGVSEYVLDVETTGLDVYNDILVGICLYNPDLPSFYVPFNHTDLQNKRVEGQMTEEECKAVMLPYLANGSLKCINHNIKFDDKVVTFQWGQRIANVWWDTNIAGWVLNENEKHGLKPMYNKYILNGEGSDEDLEISLRVSHVTISLLIFSLFMVLTMVLKHGLCINSRKSILERIIREQTTESSIMCLEILRCLLLMFVWIWSLEV